MSPDLFHFQTYKAYLKKALPTSGPERGIRSRLSQAIGCQTTFISQVLNGSIDFSLEHSLGISRFLKHSQAEEEYFMLLVQLNRAGSTALKEHYQRQINDTLEKREKISERLQASETIAEQDQLIYYSHWRYAAIHILVSIPKYQHSTKLIAETLGLTMEETRKSLDFLLKTGLVIQKDGKYLIGRTQIHISKDSPIFSKHHANWRLKSILRAEEAHPEDLHYSAVISLSSEDLKKVKSMILELLEKSDTLIADSKEEQLACMALDLFQVNRD